MKRTLATAAALLFSATGLTACSGSDDSKWFAENCATKTATIQERPGELAIISGPLAPPAALEDSSLKLGYFTYDELNESMKQEDSLEVGDTICLDRTLESDNTRWKSVETTKIEGEAKDETLDSTDFTFVRSPKYPDGIWINQFSGDLDDSYEISDLTGEKCANQWWPTVTKEEAEAASASEIEIMQYEASRRDAC